MKKLSALLLALLLLWPHAGLAVVGMDAFVADEDQNFIPMPAAYEVYDTIKNLGDAGFMNHPEDLFIDADDLLYVADTENNRVLKMNRAGTVLEIIDSAAGAALNKPRGVYVHADGSLWILSMKGRGFFRTAFFIPVLLGSGYVMKQLLGLGVDGMTVTAGITVPRLIADLLGASMTELLQGFLDRITVVLWKSGVQIVLFLAGLQGIPGSLYEAAHVDGATEWEMFWKITLPMISPVILMNVVYTIVSFFTDGTNITVKWLPSRLEWSNYKIAYAKLWFSKFVVNSSLVAILATAGHIFSCALTGYAFARYKFRFKGVLFGIVILSMIVPAQVIIFPLYMQYSSWDWLDTYGRDLVGPDAPSGLAGQRRRRGAHHDRRMV